MVLPLSHISETTGAGSAGPTPGQHRGSLPWSCGLWVLVACPGCCSAGLSSPQSEGGGRWREGDRKQERRVGVARRETWEETRHQGCVGVAG